LLRPSTHRRMAEYRELARRRLGRPALVLALSARVRDDLRRHDRLPEQQIRVLPNGVDHDRYRRDTSARDRVRHDLGLEDATVFLLLAHNSRLKGLPTALRALAATPAERRAQLLVIGRGESSAYSRLATNLGIAQRVHFIGAVDDPRPYLSCADIYLHPTLYDPCSLATLEALACELPVITTRNNGVSELMNHGREGLILEDPLDHQQLARLMLELCDSRRRAAMGRAARRLALHHSCARSFSAVFDVYRDILEDRQRKRHSSCVAP
ncbi:MAG: glycosyltransferase family 4 protein, partial [Gammaproteobacteria bacterium]|nr:glycosyltransferase family 4 protein [Gammaproteobacteria bacterium]